MDIDRGTKKNGYRFHAERTFLLIHNTEYTENSGLI